MRQGLLAAVRPLGLLTALVLVGGGPLPPHAGARPAEQAATPQPVACDVAPRSLEETLALVSPESGAGTPSNGRPIEPLPAGIPADAETFAGVSATVRQLEACINDGQLFRFMALFSDESLRRMPGGENAGAELSMIAASTPAPIPPGRRSVVIGPWHVEMLPDGRVLAAVVWFGTETDTCVDPNRVTALIFVERDGRWLVDELIEDVADGELIDVVGLPPETGLDACVSNERLGRPPNN